ncbi:MAG TPA: nucleoside-diphosphate kinase, partial [Acidimicrobiia bacterium]|nr:nucleoside-diphosphate kinase [Acidimicrobiia bacterium]
MHEHTFVMVKPDGVSRGLIGEVISRLERRGLRLERIRMLTITEEMA